MDFETFRGRDVTEALAMVRAAYGGDAIIASTRVVTNGRDGGLSQSFVEVKAAPSVPPPRGSALAFPFARAASERAKSMNELKTAPRSSRPSIGAAKTQTIPPGVPDGARLTPPPVAEIPPPVRIIESAPSKEAEAALVEVRALRELVEKMMAARSPKEKIAAALAGTGIEGKLATELGAGLSKAKANSDETRDLLRERLAKRVNCTYIPMTAGTPRMIACIGPTGSGKTTTLAKLAAYAALEKNLKVHVVTLDTFRVGAVEQMRRFATLIGVPFTVATDSKGLLEAMASGPDLLLVDTPSRGPRDAAAMGRLADAFDALTDLEKHVLLTIPAQARMSDVTELVRGYRRLGPTACVLTKLDETEQRGGAVAGAIAANMDIAFHCAGPRVPEDLASATPDAIASLVIPGKEPRS